MGNLSIKEVGARFKVLRNHLGLKQSDVAKKLKLTADTISRLENGKGGTLDTFLLVYQYYSRIFYMPTLLSDTFEVVELNSVTDDDFHKQIAMQRLELVKEGINDHLHEIMNILSNKNL